MTIIRNQVAFRMLAEHIERFPEEYDQSMWGVVPREAIAGAEQDEWGYKTIGLDCGSAACLAGTAVMLAGYKFVVPTRILKREGGRIRVDYCTRGRGHLAIAEAANSVLYQSTYADESWLLFDEAWKPAEDLTVPQALRRLADGALLSAVTDEGFVDDYEASFYELDRIAVELCRDVPAGMVL